MKAKLPQQIQSQFSGAGTIKSPSPNNPRFNEASHFGYGQQDSNNSRLNEQERTKHGVDISIRNDLLDQINNQYEEAFKGQRHSNLQDFENNDYHHSRTVTNGTNQNSQFNPSPYRQDNSVSPTRRTQNDGIEETIQGNIDGNMSSLQIQNKKAFVWAFGKNAEGELALGVYKDALLPRFVSGLKGQSARCISSSNHHTALVTQEGLLMVSGSSLHGKLGIENLQKTNINKFQVVPSLHKKKVRQVACGDYHTLCLLEDGTVYQFGGSMFKDKKDKIQRLQNPQQTVSPNVPQPIQTLYGRDIIQIGCGDFHSAALDANGDLYTWGGGAPSYNKGQCGHGHTNIVEQPERVRYLASKRIVSVACGGFHTLALTSENELFAFGSSSYGECGYGEFLDTTKPKLVKFPNDQVSNPNAEELDEYQNEEFVLEMYLKESPVINQIAAGGRHSLVLTSKGRLFTFGYGTHGQLGLKNTSNQSKPQLVKDLSSKFIVQVVAGQHHSMALTDKGDLYSCGYGGHGQIGHSDKDSKTQFTYVAQMANKNISRIFAGGHHSWVVLDPIVPVKDKWTHPSPSQPANNVLDNSRNFTPNRNTDLGNSNNKTTPFQNSNSESKPFGRNNQASLSPFQQHVKDSQTQKLNQQMSQATFGGTGNMSFNKVNQPSFGNSKDLNQNPVFPSGDDFVQKILEVQHQQLVNAQYYCQVTYCETDFSHRFINFEVHGNFVKQFEQLLEEFIQQQYQIEKGGILYHKVQEAPQQLFSNRTSLTPGERLIKETHNEGESRDYSDLDESFCPEENQRSYTLCLICNPSSCGYDQDFDRYKQSKGIVSKAKKIVVNSSSFQSSIVSQSGVRGSEENQAPLIGKIVFIKDTDIKNDLRINEFEEKMSSWMINFHRKLGKYCNNKPRYSELRPMRFSLT